MAADVQPECVVAGVPMLVVLAVMLLMLDHLDRR